MTALRRAGVWGNPLGPNGTWFRAIVVTGNDEMPKPPKYPKKPEIRDCKIVPGHIAWG